MQRRTFTLGILSVAFALALGAGSARADYTTAPANYTIPLTQTNWSDTTQSLQGLNGFPVVKFDPTVYSVPGFKAVLTEVDLVLTYTFENTLQMRFDNVSTIVVAASGTMNLTLPDGTTNLVTSPTFSNSGTQTSTISDVFSKYVTLPTYTKTGTVGANYVDQPTLSQFLYNQTGSKVIQLPVSANAQSSFSSSSGNGMGSSVTLAGASISIVYHYILPEPSSFVLTGLGVMGLGAFAVQRSRVGLKKSAAA